MIESELTTEEDYHTQKEIVERLIRRLVREDKVLVQIDEEAESHSPMLIVNPNFVMEDE